MFEVQTQLVTPVYSKPIPNKEYLVIHLLAYRDYKISEEKRYIRPYDGNKEESFYFGKTPAGWMLMKHTNFHTRQFIEYVAEPSCPTCLCSLRDMPSFKMPCCGNELHGDCFMRQLTSWKRGLWQATHLNCPLCRQNFFEDSNGRLREQWYWYNYEPLYNLINKVPGLTWESLEENTKKQFHLYSAAKNAVIEKEKELPEEERGVKWAIQMCDLCVQPEITGQLSCADELGLDFEAKFICGTCEWAEKEAKDHRCFIHGKKFAMFKCDSCCAPATWDCFSNHYCERCHNMACTTKNFPCPGKGKCPLGMAHPKNSHGRHGEKNIGFVIGCFKCFDPTYTVNSSYSANAPDPFREADINDGNIMGLFRYSAPPPKECPVAAVPVAPVHEIPVPRVAAAEESDDEIDQQIYANFIQNFVGSEDEDESSSSEEENVAIIEAFPEPRIINMFNRAEDDDDEEDDENYKNFIRQFQDSDMEEDSQSNIDEFFDLIFADNEKKLEEEDLENYRNFIKQFQDSDVEISEEEEEENFSVNNNVTEDLEDKFFDFIFPEQNENYDNFISGFYSNNSDFSESESSTISVEDDEALAFGEHEEQVLPIIAPRPMLQNCSADSVFSNFSEDTINLLQFNQGFDPEEEEIDFEDVFSQPVVLTVI